MRSLIFALLAVIFCGQSTFAQSEKPTQYWAVAYIKVAPDKQTEYLKLEKAWKKIHAAKIKDGKMNDWGLDKVVSPSGASSEYNYVARDGYLGEVQLAGYFEADYMPANWKTLLTPAELALINRTDEIRTLVKTEIWSERDKVIGDAISKSTVSVINYFDIPDGKTSADHQKMEQDIWKPVHAARIKDGKLAGWVLTQMEFPFGSAMPYQDGTVDIYADMKAYLAPYVEGYFAKAHPGKNAADLMKATREVSKLVKGEVRMRVDGMN